MAMEVLRKITKQVEIDLKDFEIFLLLQNNPQSNPNSIGKQLGYVPQDVRLRIKKLKEKGYLRQSRNLSDPILGRRLQTETEAVYNPTQLGMMRRHIIFENIKSPADLRKLELFCEIHPYVHYRSVLFDRGLNLYIQFDIPKDAENNFTILLKELMDFNLNDRFLDLGSYSTCNSKYDILALEILKNQWKIIDDNNTLKNVISNLSRIDYVWKEFLTSDFDFDAAKSEKRSTLKIDKLDALLLRELSINSRVKINDLAEIYGKDRMTISRRMKKIRQIAPNDNLYFNNEIFNMNSSTIYTGNFGKDEIELTHFNGKQFSDFIKSNILPYQTNLAFNNNQFIWHVISPAKRIPDFSYFVMKYGVDTNVYNLAIDTAKTYFFNSDMIDNEGKWNTSKSYILDIPLTKFNEFL